MSGFADKPRTGNLCACGRPAWGKGPRCRLCTTREKERQDLDRYGPDEMRKETLLTDRPRLRLALERYQRNRPPSSIGLVLVTAAELNDSMRVFDGDNDMAG